MARGSFYTTEKLGPKQSLTPEGFLLCEEVPIARTGMMIYGPDEVPIKTGPDGIIKIFREEADVFRPETMASAQGKPVTNEHPDDDVTPESWREHAVGVAMNIRRGLGAMDDLLLADFLVTTPDGIEAVQSGKREVSCGYEADYEETAPGAGRQSNIIINHMALVENGRCGPRCSISDHKGVETMKHSKILDALISAFKAKDAKEVEELAKKVGDDMGEPGEGGEGETHVHIHQEGEGTGTGNFADDDEFQAHVTKNEAEHAEMFARIKALEETVAKLAEGEGGEGEDAEMNKAIEDEVPEELKEEAAKAKDSAYLADSYRDTISMAEILVPGIKIPTFDAAAKKADSYRKICGLRRQALDLAWHQPITRGILDELLGGKDLDTKRMTCDAARTLFRSAAAMKRSINNKGNSGNARDNSDVRQAGVHTLADLNRLNAERWANK